jgi:hypothetical protein
MRFMQGRLEGTLINDLLLKIARYSINITPKRHLFILNLVHKHQIVYYKQRHKNHVDPKL